MSYPRATIDFEARSTQEIKTVGAWNYSLHPSTEVLCLAYKLPGRPVRIWTPARESYPLDLFEHVRAEGLVEAHNYFFELSIWENVMVPRFGWPPINPEQWRCSAALAAIHGIPRGLSDACKVMRGRS